MSNKPFRDLLATENNLNQVSISQTEHIQTDLFSSCHFELPFELTGLCCWQVHIVESGARLIRFGLVKHACICVCVLKRERHLLFT